MPLVIARFLARFKEARQKPHGDNDDSPKKEVLENPLNCVETHIVDPQGKAMQTFNQLKWTQSERRKNNSDNDRHHNQLENNRYRVAA